MASSKRWPEMVFRGGISLSKAHNTIKRFSEDIDVALGRAELGIKDTVSSLASMPSELRDDRLQMLDDLGERFVHDIMFPHLNDYLDQLFKGNSNASRPSIRRDTEDLLTLQMPYEPIVGSAGGYVPTTVRLEFSIKSALRPNTPRSFRPFIAGIVPDTKMDLTRIPTISVAGTFWDEILIVHELKDRHSKNLELTFVNERVSRHYYDLFALIKGKKVSVNKTQTKLAADCQRHSSVFYPNPEIDLSDALPGTLDITPTPEMMSKLKSDYNEMSVMIFGDAPPFEEVCETLRKFENEINRFDLKDAVSNR